MKHTIPDYVKEFFSYDEHTGKVYWIKSPADKIRIGNEVNYISKQYTKNKHAVNYYYAVRLLGIRYKLHRIIWFLKTGKQPLYIDHIDTDGLNNKWDNLREATRVQNAANVKLTKRNTSGYKGVSFDKTRKKYHARIMINRKHIDLGFYDLPEQAYEAYCSYNIKNNGQYANLG